MGKYYVQSGTMRSVVEAESSRKAALWAVHQVMQQVLPLDPADDQTDQPFMETEQPHQVLATRIQVSQRGFDRGDAIDMPTLQVMSQWHEMVATLDRLQRMLYRAA